MTNSGNKDIADLKTFESWVNEGNRLLMQKEYVAALICYDSALELNKDDEKVWDNRGVALSGAGRHADAIESFEISLDLKPDDFQAWANMGVSMAALKRFETVLTGHWISNLKITIHGIIGELFFSVFLNMKKHWNHLMKL